MNKLNPTIKILLLLAVAGIGIYALSNMFIRLSPKTFGLLKLGYTVKQVYLAENITIQHGSVTITVPQGYLIPGLREDSIITGYIIYGKGTCTINIPQKLQARAKTDHWSTQFDSLFSPIHPEDYKKLALTLSLKEITDSAVHVRSTILLNRFKRRSYHHNNWAYLPNKGGVIYTLWNGSTRSGEYLIYSNKGKIKALAGSRKILSFKDDTAPAEESKKNISDVVSVSMLPTTVGFQSFISLLLIAIVAGLCRVFRIKPAAAKPRAFNASTLLWLVVFMIAFQLISLGIYGLYDIFRAHITLMRYTAVVINGHNSGNYGLKNSIR